MSSAVAELEAGLQAMLALKPPGVSGSRIATLTALCTANVQSESVLIQKLYTHFKKAPGTHKLGVLYVVDSVTRKWTEQAKAIGQPIGTSAQDGTFGAGVHRVKELLPVLMNDIIHSAPEDQKEKIRKLIDIWEKGQTFPVEMLNSFKEKLNSKTESTTPPGSPPPGLQPLGSTQPAPPAAAPNTTSILEALANMARQNTTAASANPSVPAQDNSYNMLPAHNNTAQRVASLNPTYPFPSSTQSVNVPPPAAPVFAQQPQGTNITAPAFPSNQNGGVAPPAAQGTVNPALQQQLMILKTLADTGVPQEQWGGIIAALTATSSSQAIPAVATNGVNAAPPALQFGGPNAAPNSWGPRPDESRDRSGYNDGSRTPPGRYRRRSRSPSPQRGWNARDSPASRRRDEYGDFGRDSPGHGRNDDVRGRGYDYRQRSPPPRRNRSNSPPRNFYDGRMGGEKWVDFDSTITKGSIKVLSRTLFVGGVTCSDQELRSIFDRFGKVQTCIVNKDKRHAFVKMISRHDAVAAKEAMENNRNADTSGRIRSTRWGVGFGPRDCSDYATGVSIIPISKLTDADRKWMLTAEYGGSGGKPIESGMVVEEPDIEIGQGVSSKAISRRMQTDKGGSQGPRSSRDRDEEDGYRRDRRGDDRNDRAAPAAMPAIPGFPNGMPNLNNFQFPPGFVYPGMPQQPGPPGYRQ